MKLLMASIPALLMSNIQSFAGDGFLNLMSTDLSKPNTGDTNTTLIYGAIIAVVVILLLVINFKKPKNNKEQNSNENNELENK